MAKYIYPAIFKDEGEVCTVRFPDFESCYTQGDDLQDAYDMAEDVLCLTLYNMEEQEQAIPPASDIREVRMEDGEFATLISCDTLEYRKFYDNRAVKKTLSIPAWLNTMAEREDINFSAVLQDALNKILLPPESLRSENSRAK